MVQSTKQFEKIIDRIIVGKAPTAVVLNNIDTPCSYVLDELLTEYGDSFFKAHILPLRFDCTQFPDSLSLWQGLAGVIMQNLKITDNPISQRKVLRLKEGINNTGSIKMNLISLLDYVRKNEGVTVLLVMEGFESVIEKMEEYDIMKIRGMTLSLILLTVTHTSLEEIGAARYNDSYFCNQFLSYHID